MAWQRGMHSCSGHPCFRQWGHGTVCPCEFQVADWLLLDIACNEILITNPNSDPVNTEDPGSRVQGHLVPAQLPHFLSGRDKTNAQRQMLRVVSFSPAHSGRKLRPCHSPLPSMLFHSTNILPLSRASGKPKSSSKGCPGWSRSFQPLN